jgi:23S rRNA (pseudouridine1915-N3)-methyltransferase
MPDWVDAGFDDYARRMPREWPLELREVKAEPRTTGKTSAAMMVAEAVRLRAALPERCHLVALDEHGRDPTTQELADNLTHWSRAGEDVAFLIGGPDGLDPGLKADARAMMRLSSLTLPHALVRVILAEALYRAASVLKGHPYHRE